MPAEYAAAERAYIKMKLKLLFPALLILPCHHGIAAYTTLSCSAMPTVDVVFKDSDATEEKNPWRPGEVIFAYKIVTSEPAELVSYELISCSFTNETEKCQVHLQAKGKIDERTNHVDLISDMKNWGKVTWKGRFRFKLAQSVGGNKNITFRLVNYKNTGTVYDAKTIASPYKYGSVDVEQTANFGTVNPGEQPNEIPVTHNAQGSGNLTFAPDVPFQQGGALRSAQDEKLRYTMSEALWESSAWKGRLNNGTDYSLKLDNIPRSQHSGEYKGIVNVTLDCE